MNLKKDWSLILGIFAMLLLVWGTFAVQSSFFQKILFLIGAFGLGVTAFFNNQKMFMAIQAVVTIGAVIGFFEQLNQNLRYFIIIGVAVLSLVYLSKINYFKKDKWGVVGSIGLLLFAYAFSINSVENSNLFNELILIGGLLVAFYSSISFFKNKVRIALIWVILNLMLCINPILTLFFR